MTKKRPKANTKTARKKRPWNKGKSVGQKAPFPPEAVKLIRLTLERDGKLRDLALLNTAVDSMLRASDLLMLKVKDMIDHKHEIIEEGILRQKKTDTGVVFTLGANAQAALKAWIEESGKNRNAFIFTSTRMNTAGKPISRTQYSRVIKQWAEIAGLDPARYSTHSGRRTKSAIVFDRTQNIAAVQHLLGHKSIASTAAYLGVDKREALDLAREIEV